MKNITKAFDNFINKYILFNMLWHTIKLKINKVKYMLLQI